MQGLLKPVAPKFIKARSRTKVTVVGVGAVGMAAAFSLLECTGELVLIDMDKKKVEGEILDLRQGQQFLRRCTVHGGTDYTASANSDIVLVTAGARQRIGESRLELVQRNVDIFKNIIPKIVENSPQCVLIIVSNPVDVLTQVAKVISGFPDHRVFGTGTMLDSARFRFLLGEKLGVSANSVHGYVIGEHGDSSVPIWSNVNVAGVRLSSLNPDIGTEKDKDNFEQIHRDVVQSAYKIIELKGYTSWAIGLTCRSVCNAILHNSHTVYPLSTCAKGIHGIDQDICLSLPCLITSVGIGDIIPQLLSDSETTKLQSSASNLHEVIQSIKW